ncbi:MAG: MerR family transcriptional regulator [Microvirga sp.]
MSASAQVFSPSEAARRLGVSAKALRLYEQRGLVSPVRTAAGWRAYGPDEMHRAEEVVALRALGLSLAQVARVLGGGGALEPALAAHQATLEGEVRRLAGLMERVHGLRTRLARGHAPAAGELSRLAAPTAGRGVAFDLPWPWGGEPFALREIRALNYIIGPLGSGKTRLAQRLAETLPDAAFLGRERSADGAAAARARRDSDPALERRVDESLSRLVADGATLTDALTALTVALESDGPAFLVVDMVEDGLDQATQEALIARLRLRGPGARPLFLLTRSRAILDLGAVGADETIILCPANHSPPTCVVPCPGSPGYEAVATCLASPEVRARTEGVIAWRPRVA